MHSNKSKRYSNKDIQIICDYVSKYPQNMQFAFKKAGKTLKRDPRSIATKYYSLKDRTVVAVATKKGVTMNNRKIVRIKKNNTLKSIVNNLSMKQRVELLHLLVGLPPEEIGKFVANNVNN